MRRRTFLASATAAFTQTPAPQLDTDGMMLLNGRRTFILGLYQLPQGPNAWSRASKAGFHVVHTEPTRKDLDTAASHGMHGWVTLGSTSKPGDEARIRKHVTELRDHRSLMFWETEDEPSFVWKKPKEFRVSPEVIQGTYKLLKALDQQRPIYLNHSPTNLVSTLERYNPGGDIIATDIYPVAPSGLREQYALWPDGMQGDFNDSTIAQVGRYADKMRQVAGPRRALWMVLQGFAWEMLRDKDRDAKMIRYPTAAETRFMAWQSVVHGATGLLWWGLYKTPFESGLWDSIAATAKELNSYGPELAAKPHSLKLKIDYLDTGHSLDRGIEWIAKPTSAKQCTLIAVNADKNPVAVTLTARPWTRREEFEPFGVRVWRVPL